MTVPHLRTSLLAAAFALAAAAVAAPAAHATLNVVVTIKASNGTQSTAISQASVEHEQDVAQKMTFMFAGGDHTTGFETGLSIARLAQLAGVDPARVTQATITTAEAVRGANDLNTAVIGIDPGSGRNEIADGFFGDPLGAPKFALIQPTGVDGFDFVRPMRTATDDNADKILLTENNGDLGVAMTFTGEVLDVGVPVIAPTTVTVGDPVAYDASATAVTLDGATDDSGLTYAWDFGDGSALGHGASTTHRYTTAGVWPVRVTVTDTAGAVGVSAPLTVHVQPATPATTTTTSAPAAPGAGSPIGPAQGTPEGANGGAAGPLPAPGSHPSGTHGPVVSTALPGRHGAPHQGSSHTAGHHAATHAATTSAAPVGDGTGAGASGSTGVSTGSTSTGVGAAPASASATPSPAPTTARHHAPAGLVGLLVDDRGARAIALDHAAVSQPVTAARASSSDTPGGGSWAAWTGGILAVLLVVGLGAFVALEPGARYRSVAAS